MPLQLPHSCAGVLEQLAPGCQTSLALSQPWLVCEDHLPSRKLGFYCSLYQVPQEDILNSTVT